MLDLSTDQQTAINTIVTWRNDWPGGNQLLTMGGFAGTGKTTVVGEVLSQLPDVSVAAPTGKAASRLREIGVSASTIHSLIYAADMGDDGKVRFTRRPYLDAKTLIIDEASMVDLVVFKDLCNYGIPILFVGDHGQLEPIGANPQLMHKPHIRLETIHRQAENNPIIRLSKAFREGRNIPYWKDNQGCCEIVRRSELDKYLMEDAQFICGFNKTRQGINARIRAEKGYLLKPSPGERVIVLQNNSGFEVFNGQQATVQHNHGTCRGFVELSLLLDDGRSFDAPCVQDQFGAAEVSKKHQQDALLLDFAYCITAHKSQGSEFNTVVVLEEIGSSWEPARWRYTASTRAKERLVYCK